MKIIIYWDNEKSQKLYKLTKESLDSIGLSEFVELLTNNSPEYRIELNITKDYAFCVEEESIEFRDIIFEWQIPDRKELDSLIFSIIGWSPNSDCAWSCSSCGGWCWL